MEKTEQYQCQSHFDDNNVLQDCTCGKCETGIAPMEHKEWVEKEVQKLLNSWTAEDTGLLEIGKYDADTLKEELITLLTSHHEQIIKEVEEKINKVSEMPHPSQHTTYGYTQYNNHAVCYGKNLAVEEFINLLKQK